MKQNKHKWLTWLAALLLLMVSTGCLPQLLEDTLTQLLPLGKNPLQRVAVEVTMTSEQLRNEYHDQTKCEYIHESYYKHLRYYSRGIFSSQTWFDNPLMTVFAEMMGHLADEEEFVLFRKYYVPRTTIISGRSDFDAKCYMDRSPYVDFYCRGGGGLDFEGRQQCVSIFDDQMNDRIVVSGRPCEGSYYFPGCDKYCKEPGDFTTPETFVVPFFSGQPARTPFGIKRFSPADAEEMLIIPAGQFYAGTTLTETIEIPGTCGSYHTIILTLKTENADP